MLCSVVKKNNQKCKNYIFQNNLCYLHYRNKKVVKFNNSKNEVYYVEKYIHNMKKYKNGRWIYNNGKSGKKLKSVDYLG